MEELITNLIAAKQASMITDAEAIEKLKSEVKPYSEESFLMLLAKMEIRINQGKWLLSIFKRIKFKKIVIMASKHVICKLSLLADYNFEFNPLNGELTLRNPTELDLYINACVSFSHVFPREAQIMMYRLMNYDVCLTDVLPKMSLYGVDNSALLEQEAKPKYFDTHLSIM